MSADHLEDAVTALDELASNALRHGRAPVGGEVCTLADAYVLLVTDNAPGAPPSPTSIRDPAHGGMGLGMIAATALSCGWFTHDATKTVWAVMTGSPTHGPD